MMVRFVKPKNLTQGLTLFFSLSGIITFFTIHHIFLAGWEKAIIALLIHTTFSIFVVKNYKKIAAYSEKDNSSDNQQFQFFPIISTLSLAGVYIVLMVILLLCNPIYYEDEWRQFNSYLFQNTFWESVFKRQNGHLVIVPNLLFLLNYYVLGGKGLWLIVLSLFLVGSSTFIFITCLLQSLSKNLSASIKWTFVCLSIYFSYWLLGAPNLVWGSLVLNNLTTFFAFIAIYGISHYEKWDSNKGFYLFLLGAILSSISFSAGVAVWVLGFIAMILKKANFRLIALFALLMLLGGIATLGYYSIQQSSLPSFSLVQFIKSIPTFIGAPITFLLYDFVDKPIKIYGALFIGVVGLLLFLFFIIHFLFPSLVRSYSALPLSSLGSKENAVSMKAYFNENGQAANSKLFFLLICFFSIGCAMLISVGRVKGDFSNIIQERFLSWSILFWFSLMALTVIFISNTWRNAVSILKGLSIVLLLGLTITNLVRIIARLHEYNHLTTAAIDLVVHSDGKGAERDLWNGKLNNPYYQDVVNKVGVVLKEDKKDIFAQEWTHWIGQKVTSIFYTKSNRNLLGKLSIEKMDTNQDIAFDGWIWSSTTFGFAPTKVVLVYKDTIVGIGLPYCDRKNVNRPSTRQLSNLFHLLPKPFSNFPGVSNYYAGQINGTLFENTMLTRASITFYGVFEDGTYARIE